jgi:hypothetical protein
MSPMKRELYPANWPEIRAQVKERAGNKCEGCGVANHAVGARDRRGDWHDQDSIDNLNSDVGYSMFGEYPKIIRIVCTTAHLDHNPGNNDLGNLKFWCQACHNRHDAKHRAGNAALTRHAKREQIQPALF